jgi:hypothetical protein
MPGAIGILRTASILGFAGRHAIEKARRSLSSFNASPALASTSAVAEAMLSGSVTSDCVA